MPIRLPRKRFSSSRLLSHTGLGVFAVLQIASPGSIFGFHSDRQAQTAWTVRQFLRGGPLLRYETPVFGPPWANPLEFPVYQWIVALLSRFSALSIETSGRIVSSLFGFACLLVVGGVVRTISGSMSLSYVATFLMALSPVMTFWSHTVLIETCSLFLVLAWLDQALRFVVTGRPFNAVMTVIVGALAAPTKMTTFVPGLGFFFVIIAASLLRPGDGAQMTRKALWRSLACPFPALIAFVGWTTYLSHGSTESSLGSGSLRAQMFGTLHERLSDPNRTAAAAARMVNNTIGSALALALLLIVIGWQSTRRRTHPLPTPPRTEGLHPRALSLTTGIIAIAGFAAFAVTPLVFFHVHVVHDYYAVEIAPYLVISVTAMLAWLGQRNAKQASMLVIGAVAVGTLCVARYVSEYAPRDRSSMLFSPEAIGEVQRRTTPDEVVVTQGYLVDLAWALDRRAYSLSFTATVDDLLEAAQRTEDSGANVGLIIRPASTADRNRLLSAGFSFTRSWNGLDYFFRQETAG